MNILVTGGSGYVGSNIIRYLNKDHDVFSPSHRDLDLMNEERVREYLSEHTVDVVIHGAVKPAQRTKKDRSGILYHNLKMFFNIAENILGNTKLIFLSSGAVYNAEYYYPKMDELYCGTHVPTDEYGFSKYVASKYIENLNNALELRLFGVFGYNEEYEIRFISNAICKALAGLPITIRQNRFFDYLFIEDLFPILDHFIANDSKHKSFNITPNSAISLYSIAELVIDVLNKKDIPIIVKMPGLGLEYSGSNIRLHNEIHDLRFTPIREAIITLANWYRENWNLVDLNKLIDDL